MYLFILSEPNLGITSIPRDKSRANTRLCLLGLGDSSDGEVLAFQAQGPKFDPQNPHVKNRQRKVNPCNPSSEEMTEVDPWGWLANQPS